MNISLLANSIFSPVAIVTVPLIVPPVFLSKNVPVPRFKSFEKVRLFPPGEPTKNISPVIPLGVSARPLKLSFVLAMADAISFIVALLLTPELATTTRAPVGTGEIPES